ncbi:MAG: hypothetical protein ACLSXC_10420 [Beduini sp.]
MSDIGKFLTQFWKITTITNRDNSSKLPEYKKGMYECWSDEKYIITGLHAKYYMSGYILKWTALNMIDEGVEEENGHTSLIQKIEETDNGFIAYTTYSIYHFKKIEMSFDDVINTIKSTITIKKERAK